MKKCITCKKDKEYPKYVELESGNGSYSLYIKDGNFEFLKTELVSYDQILTAPFSEGKYKISGDELILNSDKGKKYIAPSVATAKDKSYPIVLSYIKPQIPHILLI